MNTNRNKIIPLAEGEALALFALTVCSQAFLLLLSCILCMVSYGIPTGDWFDATIGLVWIQPIANSLTVFPIPISVAIGCTSAIIFFAVAWIDERRASKTEAGRKASLTRSTLCTKGYYMSNRSEVRKKSFLYVVTAAVLMLTG